MSAAGSSDAGEAMESTILRGIDYEVSLADLARRSERRAWWIATAAVVVAISLAAAVVAMLPLKTSVPFLVLADPSSGTASVARLEEDALDRTIAASEALYRSHVAQFVTLREGYDHGAIRLREWRVVNAMAAPDVAAGYRALYDAGNPANPDRVHGPRASIRVRILSIVLSGATTGTPPKGATVRFQRSLYDKRTGNTSWLDGRLATLEFEFDPRLRLSESDRLNNPLGFRVTSYRTDEDFATGPGPDRSPGTEMRDVAEAPGAGE